MTSRASAALASSVGEEGLGSVVAGCEDRLVERERGQCWSCRLRSQPEKGRRTTNLLISELYNKLPGSCAYNPPMSRTILHLDLDAFFCAVEELHTPSLRGVPFAVGGRPG